MQHSQTTRRGIVRLRGIKTASVIHDVWRGAEDLTIHVALADLARRALRPGDAWYEHYDRVLAGNTSPGIVQRSSGKTLYVEHDLWRDADGTTIHVSIPNVTRRAVRPGDDWYGHYDRILAEADASRA